MKEWYGAGKGEWKDGIELEKENERMVWSWKRRMQGWYGAGLERE
jgi:hypothetical protein